MDVKKMRVFNISYPLALTTLLYYHRMAMPGPPVLMRHPALAGCIPLHPDGPFAAVHNYFQQQYDQFPDVLVERINVNARFVEMALYTERKMDEYDVVTRATAAVANATAPGATADVIAAADIAVAAVDAMIHEAVEAAKEVEQDFLTKDTYEKAGILIQYQLAHMIRDAVVRRIGHPNGIDAGDGADGADEDAALVE